MSSLALGASSNCTDSPCITASSASLSSCGVIGTSMASCVPEALLFGVLGASCPWGPKSESTGLSTPIDSSLPLSSFRFTSSIPSRLCSSVSPDPDALSWLCSLISFPRLFFSRSSSMSFSDLLTMACVIRSLALSTLFFPSSVLLSSSSTLCLHSLVCFALYLLPGVISARHPGHPCVAPIFSMSAL